MPYGTVGKPSSGGCPGAVTLCLAGRERPEIGSRFVCAVPGASTRIPAGRSSAASSSTRIPAGQKFCGECGTRITANPGPPAPSYAEITSALSGAVEQQTATAEILRVISSSPTDLQPVLDAVANNAAHLCGATDAQVFRIDGESLRRVASHGAMPAWERIPINRESATGRAVTDRRTIHVRDIEAELDSDFAIGKSGQREIGFRTVLATPLLREGTPLGAILIRRMEVSPFADNQVTLLETFADQAVIAIENVRLFKETKEALEQQTATAEILRVIASSPTDLQPVMEAVAENAARCAELRIRRSSVWKGSTSAWWHDMDRCPDHWRSETPYPSFAAT